MSGATGHEVYLQYIENLWKEVHTCMCYVSCKEGMYKPPVVTARLLRMWP